MNYFALCLSVLFFAACSAAEKPRAADFVPPAASSADFGGLRVHYNALPTLSLNDAVAREYGVTKDADSAMLVVAVRRLENGEETSAESEVSAEAFDLQGARQHIKFSAVKTGQYTDYIGVFTVHAHDSYRFEVTVKADGRTEKVKFQRNF
jgi:hypothetical protein